MLLSAEIGGEADGATPAAQLRPCGWRRLKNLTEPVEDLVERQLPIDRSAAWLSTRHSPPNQPSTTASSTTSARKAPPSPSGAPRSATPVEARVAPLCSCP